MTSAPRSSLLLAVALSSFGCADSDHATTAEAGAMLDGGALLDASTALVTAEQCPPLGTTCTSQPAPSWKSEVAPAIQRSCAGRPGCHTGKPTDPWPLGDRDDFLSWGPSVISDLQGCTMPPADSGVALTVRDRQAMSQWLLCGSPNN